MQKQVWAVSLIAVSLLIFSYQITRQFSLSALPGVFYNSSIATLDSVPDFTANPSPAHLTPEQSLQSFKLQKGYHMELVASEPMIHEPVAIAWDGNARLYVAEMDTYMQDVDGTGEHEPISRVMLLEDTNNNGKMDKSSVFIDKLILPRMLLCVGHELLVNETDNYNIIAYKDTNGDGVADQKRFVYQNNKKDTKNLEHQRSGLDWNLDNWIYVTVDPMRFRYTNGLLKVDSLASGSNGQWGLTHDNYGRLFFSRAGGEIAASGFQINPVYGTLEFKDQYSEEFNAVWPIIKTPDVQGGLRRIRPDTTLNHFTASCGQVIFRGDKLPKDLVGDYLVSEPVARIIRRAKVIDKDGKITLENAYNQQEFIASTDMNFRTVNMYTGPDGCLYILDMNRGIIQEGNWTRPNSYLRPQIQRLGLDKNIQHGRIYRLVYDGMKPSPMPHLLDEPGSKLVAYLDHPNGWWRDNAQKELVVRNDKSVIPTLRVIAMGQQATLTQKPSIEGRIHALWTLEGLHALSKTLIINTLKDNDANVRKTAVLLSEPFIKQNDEQIITQLNNLKEDASYDVRTQLVLSLSYSHSAKAQALVKKIMANAPDNEMMVSAKKSFTKNEDVKKYGQRLGSMGETDRKLVLAGANIYRTLCVTCHGADGKGLSSKVAPPLYDSPRLSGDKDVVVRILLHGLSGPIDDKNYPDVMPSMGTNSDEWIASVASYIRYELAPIVRPVSANGIRPANLPPASVPSGGFSTAYFATTLVKPEEVKKIRENNAVQTKAWTLPELIKAEK